MRDGKACFRNVASIKPDLAEIFQRQSDGPALFGLHHVASPSLMLHKSGAEQAPSEEIVSA